MKRLNEFLLIVSGIFIAIMLVYGFAYYQSPTGKAVLNIQPNYQKGEILSGILKISLKQGELLPSSSQVILESGDQSQAYSLANLTSEPTSSGNFYIEGTSLSGNGNGFGTEGVKTENPDVYFELKITPNTNLSSAETAPTQEQNQTEIPQTEPQNSSNVSAQENSSVQTNQSENVSSTPETPASASPITGGVILGFFRNTFNGITGKVVSNSNGTLEGKTTSGNSFVYNLGNSSAELVPGSVKTDSGDLPDSAVNLEVSNGVLTVSTNYTESQKGFGADFVGDNETTLSINLSSLGFAPANPEITAIITNNGETLLSVSGSLDNNAEPANVTEANQTNETNSTLNVTTPVQQVSLTSAEINALKDSFGNESVEVTKADKTGNGYVVRQEIGNFWIEKLYPVSLTENELKNQIGEDRILWLKDIADGLMQSNTSAENVSSILGSYPIGA